GPCLRSYGVAVARMSGMPADVVAMADAKALELEHFGDVNTKQTAEVTTNGAEQSNAFVLRSSTVLSSETRKRLLEVATECAEVRGDETREGGKELIRQMRRRIVEDGALRSLVS